MASDATAQTPSAHHHLVGRCGVDGGRVRPGGLVLMPKRIPRWAKTHPIMTNLIIVTILFSVGFWRVEHLYQCAQDYAEATSVASRPVREAAAKLDKADNRGWRAIDEVLSGQGDESDIDRLRRAAHHRRELAEDLAQARKENPVPEPPGTFC